MFGGGNTGGAAPTSGFSFGSKPSGFGTTPSLSASSGSTTFGGGFGSKSGFGFGTFGSSAQQAQQANQSQQGDILRILNTIGSSMFTTILEKAYQPTEPDTCLFKAKFKSAGLKLDKPLQPAATTTTTTSFGTGGTTGFGSFGAKPAGTTGFGTFGQTGGTGFGMQQKSLQPKTDGQEVVGLDNLVARANTHSAKLQELTESMVSPQKYNFERRLSELANQSNVIASLMSQCNSIYAAISFKLMKILEEHEYGFSDPFQKKALFNAAAQLTATVNKTGVQLSELASTRSSFRDFNTLWMTLDSRVIADLRAFVSQELAFLEGLCAQLTQRETDVSSVSTNTFTIGSLV